MTRTVLVTGMGGNVGQGIVRSIRAMGEAIRVVGTNTECVSGGNHLCDAFHVVPYAVAPDFLPVMRTICAQEAVELVIPSTDYETYHLGVGQAHLPPVAVSPPSTSKIFLDKLETARFFAEQGIPFAETAEPRTYHGQFDKLIVKPREGRGSRNIHVDPPNPKDFSEEYLVQRRYEGAEITTAFYVRRDRAIHGHVTMRRELMHGMSFACEITFVHDQAVDAVIRAMNAALDIRGSCNVQSIITADGAVVPFEVNGRLSGTTSIRGQLGFNDVRWTIDEYLFGRAPASPRIIAGAAVRIMLDVIYPGASLNDIADPAAEHFLY